MARDSHSVEAQHIVYSVSLGKEDPPVYSATVHKCHSTDNRRRPEGMDSRGSMQELGGAQEGLEGERGRGKMIE